MEIDKFKKFIRERILDYNYDQYYLYPAINKNGWTNLFFSRLEKYKSDPNTQIFSTRENTSLVLVNLTESKWDTDHFGFEVGKIDNPVSLSDTQNKNIKENLSKLHEYAKQASFKVLIIRINGDNLNFIHELEDIGFKYFETIIWPITDLSKLLLDQNNVQFFDPNTDCIDEVQVIAKKFQYQRGHFHCDQLFNKQLVNELYAKWANSALLSSKKIAIIKDNNRIVGYFICAIDDNLSNALGYKYGRLQSLALDGNIRGKGFGKKLFEGTLFLLKQEGCRYVDSGYATKNHLSAKLHSLFGFASAYEEITMHCWI